MNRKLLFSIFVAFGFALAASAQSFVVGNNNPSVSGPFNYASMEAKTSIKNNTGYTMALQWVRLQENLPSSWNSSVFDDQPRNPSINSGKLTLLPRQEKDLRVTFYPSNQIGTGSVDILIYNPFDSAGTVQSVSFDASTTYTVSSFFNPKKTTPNVKIYPNPVVDYFQLDDATNAVGRIEIYNPVGTKVQTITVNSPGERYSIGNLPRGLYLARLIDKRGTILFTQRISKYNP